MMENVIYVIQRKDSDTPAKSKSYKDSRKILAYTTEARAIAGMKIRRLSDSEYEVVEYTHSTRKE